MGNKKYELTEGEWVIIQTLWEREPCAAPTIQEALADRTGWTYSTVKTMMDRMAAKGLLKTKKIRNLILYESAITEPEAQKGEIMRAVKLAFKGALTPMMQFLLNQNTLSEKELSELEAIIRKKRSRNGNSAKR